MTDSEIRTQDIDNEPCAPVNTPDITGQIDFGTPQTFTEPLKSRGRPRIHPVKTEPKKAVGRPRIRTVDEQKAYRREYLRKYKQEHKKTADK